MSADGDKLRHAAHRLRVIAEKATPHICPQWTYTAVRHIARNCPDLECYHSGDALTVDQGTGLDEHGVNHWGWDRYEDAPWITAMSPQVAGPLVLLLDLAAVAADNRVTDAMVRAALDLVDTIVWPADDAAES